MTLPLTAPLAPQLARSAKTLPTGDTWAYEPKFDGFRAIVFVDGEAVSVQSRSGRPLARYFPELHFTPGHHVLDGEIVIDAAGEPLQQDFGALQQRLHPAASRVAMLAEQTPARFVAFDLLARGDDPLLSAPLFERRAALQELAAEIGVDLTPFTTDPQDAEPWLAPGAGGVANELAAPDRPGARQGGGHGERGGTIDAVVVGYRPGKEAHTVGSLILGLYDPAGSLHVVGHSSGLRAAQKRALVETLAPYETGERGHGDPSRWQTEREMEWVALRPELVVEVSFDHASEGRIRHGTKILRWREDKDPHDCALSQMSD